jgi:hypothetical protein
MSRFSEFVRRVLFREKTHNKPLIGSPARRFGGETPSFWINGSAQIFAIHLSVSYRMR